MKKHFYPIATVTSMSVRNFFPKMRAYTVQLTVTFLLMLNASSLEAQTLKKATGGTGLYKNEINWLDFTGIILTPASAPITQTYSLEGGLYSLVVTISDVSISGANAVGNTLRSYASGEYGGDGLVTLYNGGATPLRSALTLSNLGDGGANVAIGNFRVTAYAYRNSDNAALDVGMIFADAEDDGPTEYSQGTTNGSAWQVFETKYYSTTGEQRLIRSNSGATLRTICGESGGGLGNVALAYTKKIASTMAAPLHVDIELAGSGRSATAVGFLLTASDKGDAPDSYGLPVNRFFATVQGGDPGADGTYYIAGTPTPKHPVGAPALPSVPRLGALSGDVDDYTSISGVLADQDNNTAFNDEDALAPLAPLYAGAPISNYSITFPATVDPGKTTYINAWMDVNRNGIFDASEGQAIVLAASGNVTFNWAIAPGFTDSTGYSYIRLRIHTDPVGLALNPADSTFGSGEAEDYALRIITLTTLSGTVFDDANGLKGIPDSTIDGTGIGTTDGQQLYISLLNSSNALLTQVPVQADGSFSFTNVETNSNYQLVLTREVNGTTSANMFAFDYWWQPTGEFAFAGRGSDGTVDGILNVVVPGGSGPVSTLRFGIDRKPQGDYINVTIEQPAVGQFITLDGGSNPPIPTSSDYEDLPAGGPLTGRTITFFPPANADLYYDNTLVTSGTGAINNFDPSKLQLRITSATLGSTNTMFVYYLTDEAGVFSIYQSLSLYSINWASMLPVVLDYFTVQQTNCQAVLKWKSEKEENFDRYYIEASRNGTGYSRIGSVSSQPAGVYQFTDPNAIAGTNYYRLVMQDLDGKTEYSQIVSVKMNCNSQPQLKLMPNPTQNKITITGLQQDALLRIVNAAGQTVSTQRVDSAHPTVNMETYADGIYYFLITGSNGHNSTHKIIKR